MQPIYRKIADGLRRDITSGDLKPGDRLPNESELIGRFSASRNTIRLALAELANEGLVQILHGKGTYVRREYVPTMVQLSGEAAVMGAEDEGTSTHSFIAAVEIQGRTSEIAKFTVETQRASPFVAERLHLDLDKPVVLRTFWRVIDGQPWSIQTSYYPMDIAQGTEIMFPEDIPRGTVKVLAELGHVQAGYHDRIWARMPQAEERDFFQLATGVPVLILNRTAYSETRPIRLTRTVFAADRNRLAYDVGKVLREEDEDRTSVE